MSRQDLQRDTAHEVTLGPAAAKGAAVAFLPLLGWGVVGPPVAGFVPSPGLAELVLFVGVAACYVLAGLRAGSVSPPARAGVAGAAAGLLTYMLMLPINLLGGGPQDIWIVTSGLLAAGIGWGAGRIAGRAHEQVQA